MIGSILGDIAGSIYEFNANREKPKELFVSQDKITDDTILTVTLMETILLVDKDAIKNKPDYERLYKEYLRSLYCRLIDGKVNRMYPNPMGGYGAKFLRWVKSGMKDNNRSKGNGACMNIAPLGFLANSDDTAEWYIDTFVTLTHDHPESIRAAKCLLGCIIRARQGMSKDEIMDYVTYNYYPMDFGSYERLQREYKYTELVEDTVPQAIYCALTSNSLEDAISRAISIGGDADTLGAICGGLAEALYPITKKEDLMRYLRIIKNAGLGAKDFQYLLNYYIEMGITPEEYMSNIDYEYLD